MGWASPDSATSDTEADVGAAPAGAGPRGDGDPIFVYKGRRRRPLQDGGGLCSLGRWLPERRPTCRHLRVQSLRAAIQRELRDWGSRGGANFVNVLKGLCDGSSEGSPFPAERTERLERYVQELYGEDGLQREGDRLVPIRTRLLQCILRDAGDPDWQSLDVVTTGVPIGVGTRLPRTPAVYGPRRKWPLPGQEDPNAWRLPWHGSEWQENYASAQAVQEEVERQLEELADADPPKALRFQQDELLARWPDAAVASLGALSKVGADGTTQVRLLYDGTRGSDVNPRIRVRDKERGPTTADIKAVLRAQSTRSAATIGIAVDVQSAHRIIPVRESDWRFQTCRAKAGGTLYAFTCGVFGICSASYWWGRLAGALLRSIHHVADKDLDLWALLVADDLKLESTSTTPEYSLLFVLWYLALLRVPLRWIKTSGGPQLAWVGLWFDYGTHGLGLSESRAAWAVSWCTRQAQTGGGRIAELREGVGRLGFIVGALSYEAPFLSPLYSYMALVRDGGFKLYPAFVRLTLQYLAESIQGGRTYSCAHRPASHSNGPRVDAMAEGDNVGIGGWLPTAGPTGELDTHSSPWFSIRLDRVSAPWAFSKEGKPQRAIAALEAYGTLLSIRLFGPWLQAGGSGTTTLRSYTDNQSNTSALGKLATSKYPLNCVVMELAATLKKLNFALDLRWLPRELNSEADALSKGDFTGFEPALRIEVDPSRIEWLLLDRVVKIGLDFHQDNLRKKAEVKSRAYRPPKVRRGQRLRDRDPW